MKFFVLVIVTATAALGMSPASLAAAPDGNSEASQDSLPENIERLTSFGSYTEHILQARRRQFKATRNFA